MEILVIVGAHFKMVTGGTMQLDVKLPRGTGAVRKGVNAWVLLLVVPKETVDRFMTAVQTEDSVWNSGQQRL